LTFTNDYLAATTSLLSYYLILTSVCVVQLRYFPWLRYFPHVDSSCIFQDGSEDWEALGCAAAVGFMEVCAEGEALDEALMLSVRTLVKLTASARKNTHHWLSLWQVNIVLQTCSFGNCPNKSGWTENKKGRRAIAVSLTDKRRVLIRWKSLTGSFFLHLQQY